VLKQQQVDIWVQSNRNNWRANMKMAGNTVDGMMVNRANGSKIETCLQQPRAGKRNVDRRSLLVKCVHSRPGGADGVELEEPETKGDQPVEQVLMESS
jgi:hypothetical protein